MTRIRLPRHAGATRVTIGPGALGELARAVSGRAVVLLADRRVLALHGKRIRAALGEALLDVVVLPPGEGAKRPEVALRCWNRLARLPLPRSGLIVAVGGGATLDAAGFVASTWMRGVGWLAVPTTLLAQCDACLGGKTALDLSAGKNLVGSFHPPRLAVADPAFLDTVPEREFRAARFELLKAGWIGDRRLVGLAIGARLYNREPAATATAVALALKVKARLVSEDPGDVGERRLLNLGHTFGHALERATDFRLRHGDGVGVGLLAALHAALELRLLRPDEAEEKRREVLALEPPALPASLLPRAVAAARVDKKARASGLTLVLPVSQPRNGRGAVVREGLDPGLFGRALGRAMAELSREL